MFRNSVARIEFYPMLRKVPAWVYIKEEDNLICIDRVPSFYY